MKEKKEGGKDRQEELDLRMPPTAKCENERLVFSDEILTVASQA